MWDSPSVVAGEEGRSSPVPNDLRGRHPHHSGAGLLRPVIPATCATVSLVFDSMAPEKSVSDSESHGRSHIVRSPSCRLPPRPTRFVLPTGRKPSLLEAGGSASKDAESVAVISDDRRVRTVADGLSAQVTGTIGVLVRAVEAGLQPAVAHELLRQLDANGLHMTATLRSRAAERIEDAASESDSSHG